MKKWSMVWSVVLGMVFMLAAGAAMAADAAGDQGGGVLDFLLALKGAAGISAVVGIVARYASMWLRNQAFLKAAPAWLVGSKPGVAPQGWRVYVLVGLVSVVVYVAQGLLGGTPFAWHSVAAWVEVVKATAFAVFSNEVLKHGFEGVGKTN